MMNNNNLKRRRPFGHPSSAEASSLQQKYSSSSSWFETLSPDQQSSLQESASLLNISLQELVELRRPSYQPDKRQRLSVETTSIATQITGNSSTVMEKEKSPLSRSNEENNSDQRNASAYPGQSGFSWGVVGSVGSGIADCLSNLTVCPPPCSLYEPQPAAYSAVYSEPAYKYEGSRDVAGLPNIHASMPESFLASPITGQESQFSCDTPLGQFNLSNYPALQPTPASMQPTPALAVQPSPSKEEMVYPAMSTVSHLHTHDDRALAMNAVPGLHRSSSHVTADPTASTYEVAPLSNQPIQRPGFAIANPGPYGMPSIYHSQTEPGREAIQDGDSGSNLNVVFPNDRPPHGRRGPFKNHDDREKTARTRKIGSCIRCKMQRIRCNIDPSDERAPCLTCQKISHTKVFRVPCLRLKITDVKLFKPGQVKGYEWTRRWQNSAVSEISQWASPEVKTIRISEGYTGQFVELQVRQFIPQEGDMLWRSWITRSGYKRTVDIPPYAVIDLQAAERAYKEYLDRGLAECCKRICGPKEKLLWRTYSLALRLMSEPNTNEKERELLKTTLRLWMAIRLTTRSCRIVGDETLGMSHSIMDGSETMTGQIPLPPVMGAQLDSVLIDRIENPLRREMLEDFQTMVQANKQKTWLTTYLITFILLHNTALITKHDAEYAVKHGIKKRFAREDMVREYHMGANTLLAYWHYCNKNVYPFSEKCSDQELRTVAELDESMIHFVKGTRQYAIDHKRDWEDIQSAEDFGNDYYFISQIFESNWTYRATV